MNLWGAGQILRSALKPLLSVNMPRPPKLSEEAIVHRLALVPGWLRVQQAIEREFIMQNFIAALGFVQSVGLLAEIADHHPDIFLHSWNKIRITLWTHDQGGLTELDFTLAQKINSLL